MKKLIILETSRRLHPLSSLGVMPVLSHTTSTTEEEQKTENRGTLVFLTGYI